MLGTNHMCALDIYTKLNCGKLYLENILHIMNEYNFMCYKNFSYLNKRDQDPYSSFINN